MLRFAKRWKNERSLVAAYFSSTSGELEALDECLGSWPGPSIDSQLHLVDLFVNLVQEGDDEVNELVFVHLLRVHIRDQEWDIITLQIEMRNAKEKKTKFHYHP